MEEVSFKYNNLWVSPEGKCYNGLAHAVEAKKICKEVLGLEKNIDHPWGLNTAEDYLIEHGWIKLTTSAMHYYYKEDGMYDHLTNEQVEVYIKFCDYHGKKLG